MAEYTIFNKNSGSHLMVPSGGEDIPMRICTNQSLALQFRSQEDADAFILQENLSSGWESKKVE